MNKIVVTGASGFLGGRTLKILKEKFGSYSLVGTGRRSHRRDEFSEHECAFEQGDLVNQEFCDKLCEGTEIVVHCAALSSPWGSYDAFYEANVTATENLLNSALRKGVKKFIFISTPSIYFEHRDRFQVTEAMQLPTPLINNYAITKLAAERVVLSKNSTFFKTVALRPRAIIGAEDTVIMPRVLHAYKEGRLKIVGSGKNIVDLTCVINVVEAISAAISAPIGAYGKAYNITNDENVILWDEINYMLGKMNLEKVKSKLPLAVARLAAKLSEMWAKYITQKEPTLTDYGIGILARNFTLDVNLAKEVLLYHPIQTTREGIDEFVEWYKRTKDE